MVHVCMAGDALWHAAATPLSITRSVQKSHPLGVRDSARSQLRSREPVVDSGSARDVTTVVGQIGASCHEQCLDSRRVSRRAWVVPVSDMLQAKQRPCKKRSRRGHREDSLQCTQAHTPRFAGPTQVTL